MELYDIVRKLAGPIEPIGEHGADTDRLANLGEITTLVDQLMCDILSVAKRKNRHEASIKKLGISASEFIDEVENYIKHFKENS